MGRRNGCCSCPLRDRGEGKRRRYNEGEPGVTVGEKIDVMAGLSLLHIEWPPEGVCVQVSSTPGAAEQVPESGRPGTSCHMEGAPTGAPGHGTIYLSNNVGSICERGTII